MFNHPVETSAGDMKWVYHRTERPSIRIASSKEQELTFDMPDKSLKIR
jgi:hypothetical protein